eukprot:5554796-Prymnesium_polylepis.1
MPTLSPSQGRERAAGRPQVQPAPVIRALLAGGARPSLIWHSLMWHSLIWRVPLPDMARGPPSYGAWPSLTWHATLPDMARDPP